MMNKIFSVGSLAALGFVLTCGDAEAGLFRKKNKGGGCCQPVAATSCCGGGYAGGGYGYASSGYGYAGGGYGYASASPCCGSSYATMPGQPGYAIMPGQPGYAIMPGQPGYTVGGTQPLAMPMAATGSTTGTGVVTAGGTGTATGQPGIITVMVPTADAQVWFEDTALPQTGKERTFKAPIPNDGQSHTYNIKAKWTNDSGKTVEKTVQVTVKSGQTSTADFR